MNFTVPPIELAPYKVPCGPRSTSTRSRSKNFGSALPMLYRFATVIDTSSRYTPTVAEPPVELTPRIDVRQAGAIARVAAAAAAGEGDVGNGARHVGEVADVLRHQVVAADDGDAGGDLAGIFLALVGRDHDGLQLVRIAAGRLRGGCARCRRRRVCSIAGRLLRAGRSGHEGGCHREDAREFSGS